MDLLTHVLAGTAMSRSGLGRMAASATATLVVSAVLPDIDAVYWLRGNVSAFEHHRGFTHTLLGIPVMAATAVAIVWAWQKATCRQKTRMEPRWGLLYLFAVLGVASHLWLDFTLSYGLRFLAPFSHRWYSLDWNLVIEPRITLVLILGLIMSLLAPSWRRTSLALTVLALTSIWGVRGYQHHRAMLAIHQYNPTALRFSAYPGLSPYRWHGIIATQNAIEAVEVDRNGVLPDSAAAYLKAAPDAASTAAQASPIGRVCLDHATYPLLRVERRGAEHIVRIYDLRWLDPAFARLNTCTIRLGSDLQPIGGEMSIGPLPTMRPGV